MGMTVMYKILKIEGRKSRKIRTLIFLLQENGEMSTPEIKNYFIGKKISMTINELSNVLKKYGCFQHVGYTKKDSMISGAYEVKTWSLDYDDIIKKYETKDYTLNGGWWRKVVFDTSSLEFTPISDHTKSGLWGDIRQQLEENK